MARDCEGVERDCEGVELDTDGVELDTELSVGLRELYLMLSTARCPQPHSHTN